MVGNQRAIIGDFSKISVYTKGDSSKAIKYLVADGRYKYIETGSLLSIKKNTKEWHALSTSIYDTVFIEELLDP